MKLNKYSAYFHLVVIVILIAISYLYSGHSADEEDLRFVLDMVHSYKTKTGAIPLSLTDSGLVPSFADRFEYTIREGSFALLMKNDGCLGINENGELWSSKLLTRARLSLIRATGFVPPKDFFSYGLSLIFLMSLAFDFCVKKAEQ